MIKDTLLKVSVILPEYRAFFWPKISGREKLLSKRIKVGIFVNDRVC